MTATSNTDSAPWTAKKLDVNHSMVHDAQGMNVVPRIITEPGTPSENRALLIAAAPDLLEALRGAELLLRTIIEQGDGDITSENTIWRAAVAALRKASGT